MVRSYLTVVTAILLVTILSLLAGCRSIVPLTTGVWLPLLGFLIGCIIMGVLSRLRVAHVILVALAIYVGAILIVTLIDFRWRDITLGPIEFGAISDAWIDLPLIVFGLVPPLQVFLGLAAMASSWSAETVVQNLIFNLVAFVFFALIGFVLAGLAAAVGRRPSIHVVTAPEVTGPEPSPRVPSASPPVDAGEGAPTTEGVSPAAAAAIPPSPKKSAPPPPSVPAELPESPAPSAQAIATLKGKATAHLKPTGQSVPAGQARCPFCHATIVPGSTYCNSCQKQIT